MRITAKQKHLIFQVIKNFNLAETCKIYLFGSRVNDLKKGGDIDLLLVCPEESYKKVLELKYLIKVELEFALDEQRVDLTLATERTLSSDPFLVSIKGAIEELVPETRIHF